MENIILVPGPVKTSLIAEYLNKTSDDRSAGAHSVFLGQVRNDRINYRTVKAIEYSAYEEMVEKETVKIKNTITAAFSDVKDVVIVHSTGIVKAGELSLFVMVTAGHRDHATRACRHALEMIKENFPVWKKEIFDDDTQRWHET
ncbi:MAG: molybdenum cofactor biosynthesis protein MoaE [Bacteroidales bacterium]|nr:molybdenum cofactor biosynthesis protein MoaE [Bacteroidales bacterium]